jgi:hypothetical protein
MPDIPDTLFTKTSPTNCDHPGAGIPLCRGSGRAGPETGCVTRSKPSNPIRSALSTPEVSPGRDNIQALPVGGGVDKQMKALARIVTRPHPRKGPCGGFETQESCRPGVGQADGAADGVGAGR